MNYLKIVEEIERKWTLEACFFNSKVNRVLYEEHHKANTPTFYKIKKEINNNEINTIVQFDEKMMNCFLFNIQTIMDEERIVKVIRQDIIPFFKKQLATLHKMKCNNAVEIAKNMKSQAEQINTKRKFHEMSSPLASDHILDNDYKAAKAYMAMEHLQKTNPMIFKDVIYLIEMGRNKEKTLQNELKNIQGSIGFFIENTLSLDARYKELEEKFKNLEEENKKLQEEKMNHYMTRSASEKRQYNIKYSVEEWTDDPYSIYNFSELREEEQNKLQGYIEKEGNIDDDDLRLIKIVTHIGGENEEEIDISHLTLGRWLLYYFNHRDVELTEDDENLLAEKLPEITDTVKKIINKDVSRIELNQLSTCTKRVLLFYVHHEECFKELTRKDSEKIVNKVSSLRTEDDKKKACSILGIPRGEINVVDISKLPIICTRAFMKCFKLEK